MPRIREVGVGKSRHVDFEVTNIEQGAAYNVYSVSVDLSDCILSLQIDKQEQLTNTVGNWMKWDDSWLWEARAFFASTAPSFATKLPSRATTPSL